MSRPKVGSLFAGVEGFGQGLEAAGFEVAWQVEIDRDAVSILERHYPTTRRVRDVRDAGAHNLPPVDVLTFGSPCQGFSVAGRGEGLEDARSGLFGEAIRIIRELRPAVAVWENVPGAFSANAGRDFGAVLAALADAGALDIAWRVLDAQWFGVPQRRRRIFLVADFGAERAAQVLFEPEGSRWDSEACRAPWEGSPGSAEDGAGSVVSIQYGARPREYSQGLGVRQGGPAYTLDTLGEHADGVLTIAACEVVDTLSVGANQTTGFVGDDITHEAAAWDHLQVTCPGYRGTVEFGAPSHTLHTAGQSVITPMTFDWQQTADEAHTAHDASLTLGTSRVPAVSGHAGMAVRRLTPRECERLMSWPDDWTRYRADGSELSDGTRYRLIGNGVVSNVSRWIGRRLLAALDGTRA